MLHFHYLPKSIFKLVVREYRNLDLLDGVFNILKSLFLLKAIITNGKYTHKHTGSQSVCNLQRKWIIEDAPILLAWTTFLDHHLKMSTNGDMYFYI